MFHACAIRFDVRAESGFEASIDRSIGGWTRARRMHVRMQGGGRRERRGGRRGRSAACGARHAPTRARPISWSGGRLAAGAMPHRRVRGFCRQCRRQVHAARGAERECHALHRTSESDTTPSMEMWVCGGVEVERSIAACKGHGQLDGKPPAPAHRYRRISCGSVAGRPFPVLAPGYYDGRSFSTDISIWTVTFLLYSRC